ncbi:MAG: LysE family translocator [Gammaproteobacteria bacterium]
MDFAFPFLDWPALSLFFSAVLLLVLIPGPDMLLVLSQSIGGGRRAGLRAAVGIAAAGPVQIVLVASGITLLLSHSVAVFWLLQVIGCGYLIFAGLRMIMNANMIINATGQAAGGQPAADARHAFRHGFFVNLLNPQVGLFFLAFLPQFVNIEAGQVWAQVMLLGLILKTCGLAVNAGGALMFAKLSAWLARHRAFLQYKGTLSGAIFLIIAALLIFRALR